MAGYNSFVLSQHGIGSASLVILYATGILCFFLIRLSDTARPSMGLRFVFVAPLIVVAVAGCKKSVVTTIRDGNEC